MSSLPSINQFKSKLLRGGARANYFRVVGPTMGKEEFTFLCRAASLPAAAVNVVEVKTPGGRTMKYSGERTFENWNITVYNDTDMVMRKRFESWQTLGGDWDTPIALDDLDSYAAANGWYVSQLDRAGKTVRSYAFFNMWCANLGAIDLTFDDAGSIEEFTAELAYSHYVPVDGTGDIPNIATNGVTSYFTGAKETLAAITNKIESAETIADGIAQVVQ